MANELMSRTSTAGRAMYFWKCKNRINIVMSSVNRVNVVYSRTKYKHSQCNGRRVRANFHGSKTRGKSIRDSEITRQTSNITWPKTSTHAKSSTVIWNNSKPESPVIETSGSKARKLKLEVRSWKLKQKSWNAIYKQVTGRSFRLKD